MAIFVYKAKKSNAETVTGTIHAANREEAIDFINQLGLHPVQIALSAEGRAVKKSMRSGKITGRDLYTFSRQLANLLKSGVSILRALEIIKSQTSKGFFRQVVGDLETSIRNGKSLSESMRAYPKSFSRLYVTMVSAGEESGQLQQILLACALYHRKQNQIKSKVRNALAYPAFMTLVGFGTVYFILTFVLPKMSGLFESIGDDLPLATTILLKTAEILNQYWLVLVAGGAGLILVLRRAYRSPKGQEILGQFFLKIPFIGKVLLKVELSRFCRTLLLLLNSGVTIIRALDIAIPMLNNINVQRHMLKCREALSSGGSLGESLQGSNVIPTMMGHLIAIGEETGNLPEVLADIAEGYEQEADESIKVMTTLLEPILILTVGLVVGFIVFAMLLPIFQVDVLAQ